MDTEHSYYARVLDEVERLQPVGAGGGILVLNLMYPCFEPGARWIGYNVLDSPMRDE